MQWTRRHVGLGLGPLLFLLSFAMDGAGLDATAWRVAGLAAWMATWWITEAVPLAITGLLPLAMVPMLGAGSEVEAAAPYASRVIFLFLGGFLLAAGVQRWRLHERIAFHTTGLVGMRPTHVVGGFMAATALMSMWMSNTAAVLLMLPMGMCIVDSLPTDHPERGRFGKQLMLAIAYAASIGGLGTLIGTPPNAFLAAYSRDHLAQPITFAAWMTWMVPLVVLGLASTWFLLTKVLHRVHLGDVPAIEQVIGERLQDLGPFTAAERRVATVFLLVALAWLLAPIMSNRLPWPDDASIAVAGAMLLFVMPSGTGRPLLVWSEAKHIPWEVLLLFGGGLSLAAAMDRTGLATAAGQGLAAISGGNVLLIVAGAALVSLVLTEFLSNTASMAILLPVLAGVAGATGHDPLLILVPAALAASCGFMMPAATPPNAIAIGSGHLDVPTMAKAGIWMNVMFLVMIVGYVFVLDAVAW